MIEERSEAVDRQEQIGVWEGETITGNRHQGAIVMEEPFSENGFGSKMNQRFCK